MRILFLSRWFPNPPDNGARIRIFNLLKQLATKHEIVLVSFTHKMPSPEAIAQLTPFCREVYAIPYQTFQPQRLNSLHALLSPLPRSVVDTYSKEMERKVRLVATQFQPDLVLSSEIDMAPYARLVPNAKRLLEELEITILQEASRRATNSLARLRHSLTWWKHKRYVTNTLQHFDGCTVVSPDESEHVASVIPAKMRIRVIPNGVDLARYQGHFGEIKPNTLIYSGSLTYNANFDAAHYFKQEIMPIVQKQNPDVHLTITGSTQGVNVHEFEHPNITLTGNLPDLRPTLAESCLTVVPLRIGGGTRLKILESLAIGTPVVTTSKGIEGLQITHGEGVFIADTPVKFAEAVQQVLSNPALRKQLSEAGRKAVRMYDWQYAGASLLQLIDEITQPHTSRPGTSIKTVAQRSLS